MTTEKPTPPEGYEVMKWEELPPVVPEKCLYWSERKGLYDGRWDGVFGIGGLKECTREDLWYAVPAQKPAAPFVLDDTNSAVVATFGSDPKKSQGEKKPQLQLIPPALNAETAKVLARGAEKYGPWNWRDNKVEIMTYLGAMKRHIDCLIQGEDLDLDTGAHHLGCVAAGCGIVLDAREHGTLVDNRPPKKQTT